MNRLRNHPPPKVKSPLFDIEHDMLQISKLLGHLFLTTVHKSHFKPTNAQLIFKRLFAKYFVILYKIHVWVSRSYIYPISLSPILASIIRWGFLGH